MGCFKPFAIAKQYLGYEFGEGADPCCAAHVGVDQDSGMKEIYKDPNLDFCVLAYNMAEARHRLHTIMADHGPFTDKQSATRI